MAQRGPTAKADAVCFSPDYNTALFALDSYATALFREHVPTALFPATENPIFASAAITSSLPAHIALVPDSLNEYGDCEELEVRTAPPTERCVARVWMQRVNVFIQTFMEDKTTPATAMYEEAMRRPLQITGI